MLNQRSPIEQYQHDVIGADTKFEHIIDAVKYHYTTQNVGKYISYLEGKHQQLIDEHTPMKYKEVK